jgi:hypothetical protein
MRKKHTNRIVLWGNRYQTDVAHPHRPVPTETPCAPRRSVGLRRPQTPRVRHITTTLAMAGVLPSVIMLRCRGTSSLCEHTFDAGVLEQREGLLQADDEQLVVAAVLQYEFRPHLYLLAPRVCHRLQSAHGSRQRHNKLQDCSAQST